MVCFLVLDSTDRSVYTGEYLLYLVGSAVL